MNKIKQNKNLPKEGFVLMINMNSSFSLSKAIKGVEKPSVELKSFFFWHFNEQFNMKINQALLTVLDSQFCFMIDSLYNVDSRCITFYSLHGEFKFVHIFQW